MFHYQLFKCTKLITTSHQFTRLINLSACSFDSNKTHYNVLGLTQRASQEEIRNSFVKLSKEIHPDINRNDPDNHSKFVRLNEAYSVLSKLSSRQQYDMSLAYQLRARASSMSHTAGNSAAPGSGQRSNNDSSYQQSADEFWDETIWEMRDRTKDANAFYSRNSYYGIKGLKKQTNGVVAAVVVLFVIFGGGVYFFLALQFSQKEANNYMLMSAKNSRILKEVEEQARINGTTKQLEILQEKIAAAEAKRRARILASSPQVIKPTEVSSV